MLRPRTGVAVAANCVVPPLERADGRPDAPRREGRSRRGLDELLDLPQFREGVGEPSADVEGVRGKRPVGL